MIRENRMVLLYSTTVPFKERQSHKHRKEEPGEAMAPFCLANSRPCFSFARVVANICRRFSLPVREFPTRLSALTLISRH